MLLLLLYNAVPPSPTSLNRPIFSCPKVTMMKRFHCSYIPYSYSITICKRGCPTLTITVCTACWVLATQTLGYCGVGGFSAQFYCLSLQSRLPEMAPGGGAGPRLPNRVGRHGPNPCSGPGRPPLLSAVPGQGGQHLRAEPSRRWGYPCSFCSCQWTGMWRVVDSL